jgi:AcrR family transcriptional regulator
MPTVESRTARRGYRRGREDDRGGEQGARTRILDAAYTLFSRHGIHAVGVDRIVAEAPVAKATLYHHFASKEELVCAFLDLRQKRWTVEWLQAEAERRAATAEGRALAVFEALDEWFNRPDYEGCSFIKTLLEISDRNDPIHQAAVRHLDDIRVRLQRFAEQAGTANPAAVAYQLQILMMGAIVAASFGDGQAARRAKPLAERLLNASR